MERSWDTDFELALPHNRRKTALSDRTRTRLGEIEALQMTDRSMR